MHDSPDHRSEQQRQAPSPERCRSDRWNRAGFAASGRRRGLPGTFLCARCGNPVFSSRELFPARTVWPVFWAPLAPDCVRTRSDLAGAANGRDVSCVRCASLLGRMYEDGRPPTGSRYFIDSRALLFVELRRSDGKNERRDANGPRFG